MINRWVRRGSKGFTLIELMIVIAIIGILAAIAIPNFMKFQTKAKTAESRTNLGSIRTAEEAYRAEKDVYQSASEVLSSASWPTLSTDGFVILGFAPKGTRRYDYEVAAGSTTFAANAEANLTGDSGGTPIDQWNIDQDGNLVHTATGY